MATPPTPPDAGSAPHGLPLRKLIESQSRLVLAMLILAFIVFDAVMATGLEIGMDEMISLVLGLVFAQCIALAVWVALAPFAVHVRVPVAVLGGGLLLLSTFLCIDRSLPHRETVPIIGSMLCQWIAIQIPLWILRVGYGWRLSIVGAEAPPDRSEVQFGIRQLLIWMVIVAVLCAVGRIAVAQVSASEFDVNPSESLFVMGTLTFYGAMLSLPLIWASFVRRWVVPWFLVALVVFAFVTLAEISTIRIIMPGADAEVLWLLNGIQFATAAFTLLVVRACGVRLDRGHSLWSGT